MLVLVLALTHVHDVVLDMRQGEAHETEYGHECEHEEGEELAVATRCRTRTSRSRILQALLALFMVFDGTGMESCTKMGACDSANFECLQD